MRRTVDKMCGKGWTVVVYNRRGHRDRSGIRSNVVDAVDAEVSELACEVTSPRYPEAEEAPDVGPAAVSGVPLAQDKRKRPWPMYSDLEDMHEVCQRGPVVSDRSIALGAYRQPGRPRPGVGCVLHVTCLRISAVPALKALCTLPLVAMGHMALPYVAYEWSFPLRRGMPKNDGLTVKQHGAPLLWSASVVERLREAPL